MESVVYFTKHSTSSKSQLIIYNLIYVLTKRQTHSVLLQGDFNVIVVDWKNGANKVNYYRSVANTRLVGAQVGFLVKALEDQLDIARADVHIIGLSLGAHTAGYAGKSLAGIGRISGIKEDLTRLICYQIITKLCDTEIRFAH